MLDDFQDFLSRLGAIPEKRINFYVLWVRRFLKFFAAKRPESLVLPLVG